MPGPFGQRLRHRFAEHHGGPVPERGGTGTDAGRPDVAVAWLINLVIVSPLSK